MVSSLCADPDSDRPVTHGAPIVFFSFQPCGERGRFGFFSGSRFAVYDSRRVVGLCGCPFFNRLVCGAVAHTTTRSGYVIVSWPSLCILTRGITPTCLLYTSDAADERSSVDLG